MTFKHVITLHVQVKFHEWINKFLKKLKCLVGKCMNELEAEYRTPTAAITSLARRVNFADVLFSSSLVKVYLSLIILNLPSNASEATQKKTKKTEARVRHLQSQVKVMAVDGALSLSVLGFVCRYSPPLFQSYVVREFTLKARWIKRKPPKCCYFHILQTVN